MSKPEPYIHVVVCSCGAKVWLLGKDDAICPVCGDMVEVKK